jgi:RNA polymerase sigma-70 factor (ECF subfamily)
MATSLTDDAPFETLRGRLFGLAYRMLGVRAEAEDVVQETYIRWHHSERPAIRNPEAWLVTTATRLAIDRLRALSAERKAYSGPWLPEPLVTSTQPPDSQIDLAADLSIAFLVLLERLGPEERAAFLLHEVFDRDYDEIATTLGKSEAACRQIVHRARERVRSNRPRFRATDADKARILHQFTKAVEARDERTLLALFAPDATWTADGGGQVPASPRPIVGADRLVTLVIGLQERLYRNRTTFQLALVNGEPGLCVRIDGEAIAVMAVECDSHRIHAVYGVVNPDKLGDARRFTGSSSETGGWAITSA